MLSRRQVGRGLVSAAGLWLAGARLAWGADRPALPALKSLTSVPLSTTTSLGLMKDQSFLTLAKTHVQRLTPSWQMKMEVLLSQKGQYQFETCDELLALCRKSGFEIYGHTLIWFAQTNAYFDSLKSDRPKFTRAYDAYIREVLGRYGDALVAMDVVNEPVTDQGDALRLCHWSEGLGGDYIVRAFRVAAEAKPRLPLFLNEFALESKPNKLKTFLKLVDQLRAQKVKLDGLGCQTHLSNLDDPKSLPKTFKALATTGLQIHISEFDIHYDGKLAALEGLSRLRDKQLRLVDAVAEGLAQIPRAQRFGLTLWDLRDKDSWYASQGTPPGIARHEPCLFDDQGQPKPMAYQMAKSLKKYIPK